MDRVTLSLARITAIEIVETKFDNKNKIEAIFREPLCPEALVLEISKQRNAVERFMLQFASFEPQTDYDKEADWVQNKTHSTK